MWRSSIRILTLQKKFPCSRDGAHFDSRDILVSRKSYIHFGRGFSPHGWKANHFWANHICRMTNNPICHFLASYRSALWNGIEINSRRSHFAAMQRILARGRQSLENGTGSPWRTRDTDAEL